MATMERDATREEIIHVVRAGTMFVAWITPMGAIVYMPSPLPIALVPGASASLFNGDVVLIVNDGIEGLASIDPEWDGEESLICAHCGKPQDADWLEHDKRWNIKEDPCCAAAANPKKKIRKIVDLPN